MIPSSNEHNDNVINELKLHRLNVDAERRLWHEQLCHCNDFALQNAHKHIIGIPKMTCKHGVLDDCPVCMASKLKRRPKCKTHSAKPTICFQQIHIDIGFSGQESKTSD